MRIISSYTVIAAIIVLLLIVVSLSLSPRDKSIQNTGVYWIEYTSYQDMPTLHFRNKAGRIGLPMSQEQAIEIDRYLRIQLGLQTEDTFPMGEVMEPGVVVRNPIETSEMIFVTSSGNEKDAYSIPTTLHNTIYAYNTQTQKLRTILSITSTNTDQVNTGYFIILGTIADGRLILYETGIGSSPGPCFNAWIDPVPLYTLNLNQREPKLKIWSPPRWKLQIENAVVRVNCPDS